jgi:hypothetical protein
LGTDAEGGINVAEVRGRRYIAQAELAQKGLRRPLNSNVGRLLDISDELALTRYPFELSPGGMKGHGGQIRSK